MKPSFFLNASVLKSRFGLRMHFQPFILLSVISSFGLAPFIRAQGTLAPPAAPAPTMKSLDQVEPRIDLQAPTLPAGVSTSATIDFSIDQPGSYYLSKNLVATKTNAIQINAEGVTLDLNGFQISQASSGSGIFISGTSHRATIRNGSIKGCAAGISVGGGDAKSCRFADLAIGNCTNLGINAGGGAVLESCRVHDCSGGVALFASGGSTLRNCAVSYNTSPYALNTGDGCTLSDCAVFGNTGNAALAVGSGCVLSNCAATNNIGTYAILAAFRCTLINCTASGNNSSYGISVSDGSRLTNCVASTNNSADTTSCGIFTGAGVTVTACTANVNSTSGPATASTGGGIFLGSSCTVIDCMVQGNAGDGIRASTHCRIVGNLCDGNGNSGDGAGIHVTSSVNVIENNQVAFNDRGIDVPTVNARNLIIRNKARSNTSNYVIKAGNHTAQIVAVGTNASDIADGNSGSTDGFTNVDPLANLTY